MNKKLTLFLKLGTVELNGVPRGEEIYREYMKCENKERNIRKRRNPREKQLENGLLEILPPLEISLDGLAEVGIEFADDSADFSSQTAFKKEEKQEFMRKLRPI